MNEEILHKNANEFLRRIEEMNQSSWNWSITVSKVKGVEKKVLEKDLYYLSQLAEFTVKNEHVDRIKFSFWLEFVLEEDAVFLVYFYGKDDNFESSSIEIGDPEELWMYLFQEAGIKTTLLARYS